MIADLKKSIKTRDMELLKSYLDELHRNPKLTNLFIELTDACNLRCLHCGSSCGEGEGHFIDTGLLLDTLDTIAEDFLPADIMMCLTGGEPLLHPDFGQIVDKIVSLGFSWGITTNGTVIDREMAVWMKSRGLQSVTISIDGLETGHDALRQVKGAYKKARSAVAICNEIGLPVQITTVVHHENYHELEKIYQEMCDMNIFSWRVINIEPIGRALEHEKMQLTGEEMTGLLNFIREKRFSANTPMDVRFGCSHYLSFEFEHELRDDYFWCASGICVGSILHNGDIYSCLDIERRPELIQGNVRNDRFSKVWYNGFKEFREDRTLQCGKCLNCGERKFCRGDSTHTWDYDRKEPRFCILDYLK